MWTVSFPALLAILLLQADPKQKDTLTPTCWECDDRGCHCLLSPCRPGSFKTWFQGYLLQEACLDCYLFPLRSLAFSHSSIICLLDAEPLGAGPGRLVPGLVLVDVR